MNFFRKVYLTSNDIVEIDISETKTNVFEPLDNANILYESDNFDGEDMITVITLVLIK